MANYWIVLISVLVTVLVYKCFKKYKRSNQRKIQETRDKLKTYQKKKQLLVGDDDINKLLNKRKILVVDDDQFFLDTISVALNFCNMEVVTASSGDAAIKILEAKNDIDLIMLDLIMPRKMGITVLEEIKSNKKLQNIPILINTGLDDINYIKSAITLGANDYIMKPFGIKQIMYKMACVLAM